jgi:ribonuclease P protein component
MTDEADLSTEQPGARTSPRLPRTFGNSGRSQRPARSPQPRPEEAVRLTDPAGSVSVTAPAETASLTILSVRRDFLAANAGKRARMPGFVLLVRDRQDGSPDMRIGYTVTKKIGNAVVRNRMKRRLRELARDLLPTNGIRGADHVLIGRNGGIERDYALLRTELTKALAKVMR